MGLNLIVKSSCEGCGGEEIIEYREGNESCPLAWGRCDISVAGQPFRSYYLCPICLGKVRAICGSKEV